MEKKLKPAQQQRRPGKEKKNEAGTRLRTVTQQFKIKR